MTPAAVQTVIVPPTPEPETPAEQEQEQADHELLYELAVQVAALDELFKQLREESAAERESIRGEIAKMREEYTARHDAHDKRWADFDELMKEEPAAEPSPAAAPPGQAASAPGAGAAAPAAPPAAAPAPEPEKPKADAPPKRVGLWYRQVGKKRV